MTAPLFNTVLVANRGEIAVRVIRSLRALGIRSVAVYSDADAEALHVRLADKAVRIGPAEARSSYLDAEAVIAAAVATGAQAVHPGYGFLSENAGFARACADAGLVFIGPDENALEVMGDKIRAKAHVAASGVPVVPGVADSGHDDAALAVAALEIGLPLLVKPSAGGGGKGMQLVRSADELPDAITTARRVASAAFGDDTLLVERFIDTPRHIEVQVLADAHGTVVHLGERECSLQRRHQKVIEEAPSPLLDAETRERIGAAACDAARSVDYRGAGTVEFLVSDRDPGTFFFIEMNTRLQVEHPVTELVTGVDIVAEQLRIAAGEPLSFTQEDVVLTGHAIEARVYAESPERGFLPATGRVLALREAAGDGIRVDSSLVEGGEVTGHYDPMLAKVIGHGADRSEALARLDRALAETVVLGVDTNVGFLRDLLAEPAVQEGRLGTELIDRMPVPAPVAPPAGVLEEIAAGMFRTDGELGGPWRDDPGRDDERTPRAPASAASALWRTHSGWRLGVHRQPRITLLLSTDEVIEIPVLIAAHAQNAPEVASRSLVAREGARVWVHRDGRMYAVTVLDRAARLERSLAAVRREGGAAAPELRSPMPGTLVAVHVADGDRVESGQSIASVEAMKMEHRLTAPIAGVVRLRSHVGSLVIRDQVVATIEEDEPAASIRPEEPARPSSPDASAADTNPAKAPQAPLA